jgi:dolichyl-phosphate beta-glucosyltransferase
MPSARFCIFEDMYLSFIIPAYNESARIEASLNKTLDYFTGQPYEYEVLVVDDGSRDATAEIVERYAGERLRLLRQPRNMGKGAAVRRGMLEGRGEHRIFSDADFSTPIGETDRMLEQLRHYDVVIGSRAIDVSYIKEHQPWYRETMGIVFNRIVQMVAVPGIKDTQCGFKGFRARAAEDIFPRTKIDGFSFDVEALFLARSLGYSIKEMPVEWHNDARSTLNPVSDSLKMFRELIKIRSLHRDIKG